MQSNNQELKMLKLENELLTDEVAKLKKYIMNMESSDVKPIKIYTDDEIKALLNRLDRRGLANEKLEEVEMAFQADVYVTAQQAARIIGAIKNQECELKACLLMYRFLSNKNEVGVVCDEFLISSNRARFWEEIKKSK
jgi:hypothetical protein